MRGIGVITAVRVVFVAIVVLVAACQIAEPELSPDPGELRGDWLVVEVNGKQSRELGVIVTFDDGTADTDNVCNAFTVNYGFGDTAIQRLLRNTTVTYAGVGCDRGEDVDEGLLRLLYFNTSPTAVTIDGDRLQLVSGQMTAELNRQPSTYRHTYGCLGQPFTVLVTAVVGWTRSGRFSLDKEPGEVTETDTSDLHR